MSRLKPFFLLVLLVAALGISPARAAVPDPLYTIDNVQVDITSTDAATARAQAFPQAQQAAFRQLAQKLLGADAAAGVKLPDDITLATMIKDYETTNEQLSTVRYIGTYTIRFRGAAVRAYLGRQGLTANAAPATPAKPLLILPFYQPGGGGAQLWQDDNPWRAAWLRAGPSSGLVPVLAPLGDAQDVTDVEGGSLTLDHAGLARMLARYNAGEAVIAVAAPAAGAAGGAVPAAVTVTLYRTDHGQPEMTHSLTIAAQPGDDMNALYSRALQQVLGALQHNWKRGPDAAPVVTISNAPVDGTGAPVEGSTAIAAGNLQHAHIRFNSLQDWLSAQNDLHRVAGVSDVHVLSLAPDAADVEFGYQGDAVGLSAALTQAGLTAAPSIEQPGGYDLSLNGAD